MQPIWVGSPDDVRRGDQALKALAARNDARYWTEEEGIVKVDRERWEEAQKFECDGWLEYWRGATDDRPQDHWKLFEGYNAVPKRLGDVAEFGCGPFTQLRYISKGIKRLRFLPGPRKSFTSAALIDPLAESYLTLPNCSYTDGSLCGRPVKLFACQAEEHQVVDAYDTVICINVLEHVQDAWLVLENLFNALKPGGHLILGERTYDSFDVSRLFDVGHPIRIKTSVIRKYQQRFDVLFSSDVAGHEGYFIGKKLS